VPEGWGSADRQSPDDSAPALRARGLRKTFGTDTAPVRALRGTDLTVGRGELVALMGPSGCGKSTLLNVVAGLERPDEGSIVLAGTDVTHLSEDGWARTRRHHIGLVFQFFHLLDGMTAQENVALAALAAGASRRTAQARAAELLDLLGLLDKARSSPAMLSGGQRQRLAIARALANSPTLLLADEPTGALDSDGAAEVLDLFRLLNREGQSILLVTHDPAVAAGAQRVVRMRDGSVHEEGPADTGADARVVAQAGPLDAVPAR
jgi:putative ABC transport system ATP-binding protein